MNRGLASAFFVLGAYSVTLVASVPVGAVVTARHDAFWERIRSWRRNAGAAVTRGRAI